MEQSKEYFAFISYQRQDEDWAKWLAHELEHYHLPVKLNTRDDLPKELRPIFRDVDELSAGNLPEQIQDALRNSKNLIVICSRKSAKSKWVNKEVEEFIKLEKTDRIFPFIIDGIANSGNPKTECFPPALRQIPNNKERCGANISESTSISINSRMCQDCPLDSKAKKQGDIKDRGRDAAVVKIVAGMLNLRFDTLWERYEKEKAEEERKIREQRDNLLRLQSRFLAEKADDETASDRVFRSRLIAIEALKKAYTREAENALRRSFDNKIIKLSGHTRPVTNMVFSPDGNLLASASEDRSIRVWDLRDGRCIMIFVGHTDAIRSINFNSSNKLLVSTSYDNTIRIWNLMTNKQTYIFRKHCEDVQDAIFSPDDEKVISASENRIYIWDIRKMCCPHILNEHCSSVSSLVNNPDGTNFASISKDKICVWDSKTYKVTKVLENEYHQYSKISYSHKGDKILMLPYGRYLNTRYSSAGSLDYIKRIEGSKEIEILDSTTLEPIARLDGDYASFSNDDNYIITSSDNTTIDFLNTDSCKKLKTIKSDFDFCVFSNSNNGNRISLALSNGNITVIDYTEDRSVLSYSARGITGVDYYSFWPIFIGPDSKYVIARASNNKIYILNTGNYNIEKVITTNDHVNLITFCPKGRYVAFQSNNKIKIWDIDKSQITRILDGHTDYITSITFSPDGNKLVSASRDHTIRIWDIESNRCVKIIKAHLDTVYSASYSPDGRQIVSASDDKTIRIWDAKNYKCIVTKENKESVYFARFMPEGNIISVSETITIWDNGLLKKKQEISGRFKNISNDCSLIALEGKDHTIMICDVSSGDCLQTLLGHADDIDQVIFSSDNRVIISTSDDGMLKIWEYPKLEQLIALAKEQVKDLTLSPEERDKYYLD